jgi:WD40-like Beta Propeller Repeat
MPRTTLVLSLATVAAAALASPSSSLPSVASPQPLIAFSAGAPGGVQDIYVIRADGSGPRRLTHAAAKEFTPSWSPDGRWIAYRHQPGSDETGEIYAMRADGSGVHNLTRNGAMDYAPAWSPRRKADRLCKWPRERAGHPRHLRHEGRRLWRSAADAERGHRRVPKLVARRQENRLQLDGGRRLLGRVASALGHERRRLQAAAAHARPLRHAPRLVT